jgi:hypothetical protein
MAKKDETKESKKDALRNLLKLKLPAVFEREPAPAYATGNLEALLDLIEKIYK